MTHWPPLGALSSIRSWFNSATPLPAAWPAGSVKGLRARGGFEVKELAWQDGKLVRAEIRSILGGDVRLRYGQQLVTRTTKPGETFVFTP